jgi:Zn-dependent protease with chaperone function
MALLSRLVVLGLVAHISAGCASSTEAGEVGADRRQILLVPNEQVVAASIQAYGQTLSEAQKKGALDRDSRQVARVQNAMKRLVPQTTVFRKDAGGWAWESHVITSKDVNAYCMPGGKIVFYSSIIEKLNLTDDEIAAIMGHEIAHALREHGRERMSQELMKQGALAILVGTGVMDPKYAQAANIVTTVMVTMRHGRGQETEADQIGIELAARAGFDPRAAITLWEKMEKLNGGGGPEWLSTHPSNKRRIKDLSDMMPAVMPLYERNKAG